MLQAMLALQHAQFDLGSFQPLLTVLSNAGINKPLNLFGMFEFRHLTASWRFDGRQQDAAEYLTNILQHPSGSLRQVQWQARTDGQEEGSDSGLSPLLLRMPSAPAMLQDCLNMWSEHTFQRAMCWQPELLPVVLCADRSQVSSSHSLCRIE